jgi:hypothetical protein
MNAKANLPLPLELTQPVAMATDLSTALAKSYDVSNTRYNPETQMGTPEMWRHHGGHNTKSKCFNGGFIQIDDILQDFHL